MQADNNLPGLRHDEPFAQEVETVLCFEDAVLVLHLKAELRQSCADQPLCFQDGVPAVIENQKVIVVSDIAPA